MQFAVEVYKVTHSLAVPKRELLECWTVQLDTTAAAATAGTSSSSSRGTGSSSSRQPFTRSDYATMYKKLLILTRCVFGFARMVPCHRLAKRARGSRGREGKYSHRALDYHIDYRLDVPTPGRPHAAGGGAAAARSSVADQLSVATCATPFGQLSIAMHWTTLCEAAIPPSPRAVAAPAGPASPAIPGVNIIDDYATPYGAHGGGGRAVAVAIGPRPGQAGQRGAHGGRDFTPSPPFSTASFQQSGCAGGGGGGVAGAVGAGGGGGGGAGGGGLAADWAAGWEGRPAAGPRSAPARPGG
eukprot:SAG22_NODE_3508_length_1673_cov_4.916773_2_plen_298_part_01